MFSLLTNNKNKKFGPDRFSCFDVYWIQTNKQTDKPNLYIDYLSQKITCVFWLISKIVSCLSLCFLNYDDGIIYLYINNTKAKSLSYLIFIYFGLFCLFVCIQYTRILQFGPYPAASFDFRSQFDPLNISFSPFLFYTFVSTYTVKK